MSLLSDSAEPERPLRRELGHVITATTAMAGSSAVLLYVTAAASTNAAVFSPTGLSELTDVGRQVSKDVSFLFPTLITVQALLIGVPLARVRTRGRTATGTARLAGAASYGVGAIGITALILVSIAASHQSTVAARLWTTAVLLLILLAMALATGTLVFGPAAEQLRQERERLTGLSTTLERLEHRVIDGADPTPTSSPTRNLIVVAVATLLVSVAGVTALVGTRSRLDAASTIHTLVSAAALSGWAIVWCTLICLARGNGYRGSAIFLSLLEVATFVALVAATTSVEVTAIFTLTHVLPFAFAWAPTSRRSKAWNTYAPIVNVQTMRRRRLRRQVEREKTDIRVLERRLELGPAS